MEDFILGIKIASHSSTEIRIWHTRQPLCPIAGTGNYYTQFEDLEKKSLPILTKALIRGLEAIPGVRRVSCWPYQIIIEKSPAYSWEEIIPSTIPVFVSYHPVIYLGGNHV